MGELMEGGHKEQMTELMSLALDGQLGDKDQRRLEDHLATCSDCQTEWEAMQKISALFEEAPMVGPPLGFAIRVERRLSEKTKKRRRAFGGFAVLTGSLSLAGVTVAVVVLLVLGGLALRESAPLPEVQQSTNAVSQVASGMGLVGKGASLILMDLLSRYGPPLVLLLGVGLMILAGIWVWVFIKRPGNRHRNGYV
jgi:predicted anti-sigma-YlaC factor YlaD